MYEALIMIANFKALKRDIKHTRAHNRLPSVAKRARQYDGVFNDSGKIRDEISTEYRQKRKSRVLLKTSLRSNYGSRDATYAYCAHGALYARLFTIRSPRVSYTYTILRERFSRVVLRPRLINVIQ